MKLERNTYPKSFQTKALIKRGSQSFRTSSEDRIKLRFQGPKSQNSNSKPLWEGMVHNPTPKIVAGAVLLGAGIAVKLIGLGTVVAAPVLIPLALGIGLAGAVLMGWGGIQYLNPLNKKSQEKAVTDNLSPSKQEKSKKQELHLPSKPGVLKNSIETELRTSSEGETAASKGPIELPAVSIPTSSDGEVSPTLTQSIKESAALFQQEKAQNPDQADCLLKAVSIKISEGREIQAVIYKKSTEANGSYLYELRKPTEQGGELLESIQSHPEEIQYYHLPVKDYISLEFKGNPLPRFRSNKGSERLTLQTALLNEVMPTLAQYKKPIISKNNTSGASELVFAANGFHEGSRLDMQIAPDHTLGPDDFMTLKMPEAFKGSYINTSFCPAIPTRSQFIQELSVYRNEPFTEANYHLYGSVSPEGVVKYEISRPLSRGGQVFATATAVPKTGKLYGKKADHFYELSLDRNLDEANVVKGYKHDYKDRLTTFLLAKTLKTLDETGEKTIIQPTYYKGSDNQIFEYRPDDDAYALGLIPHKDFAYIHDPMNPAHSPRHVNAHEWSKQYVRPEDCGKYTITRVKMEPCPDFLGDIPFKSEEGKQIPVKAYGHLSQHSTIWLNTGDEEDPQDLIRLRHSTNAAPACNIPSKKLHHLEFDFYGIQEGFGNTFSVKDKRVLMDAVLKKACQQAKEEGLVLVINRSVSTLGQEDILKKNGFTQDVQGIHARYPGSYLNPPSRFNGAFIFDGSHNNL